MNEGVRINKYLSEAGICSRREADCLIGEYRIHIGSKKARKGDRVRPDDLVYYDGNPVRKEDRVIMLAFHKPKGIVCTTSRKEKNNIVDYVGYPSRIYPVGRLDKDSEGLLLLTNQGGWMDKILRGRNLHEKEYVVKVDHPVTESFLTGLQKGVPIADGLRTRPCMAQRIGEDEFRIVLTQGLNRQVRKMCEYFGYRVTRLQRIRIMNIQLGALEIGKYRTLTDEEWEGLTNALGGSN